LLAFGEKSLPICFVWASQSKPSTWDFEIEDFVDVCAHRVHCAYLVRNASRIHSQNLIRYFFGWRFAVDEQRSTSKPRTLRASPFPHSPHLPSSPEYAQRRGFDAPRSPTDRPYHSRDNPQQNRMASSVCASASAVAYACNKFAGSSAKSGFTTGNAGKAAPLSARTQRAVTRRRGANVTTQAVVTPPKAHDSARPDTTLRPVSAAAVDSSKALEQFRSMGGASRKSPPPPQQNIFWQKTTRPILCWVTVATARPQTRRAT
jgi:hypothetical protein